LDNGQLVKNTRKLVRSQIRKPQFYITNILPLIPIELLLAPFMGFLPILRLNRLLKLNRVFELRQITETITNFPNIFRLFSLFFIMMILIHWVGCFYFLISKYTGFETGEWLIQIKLNDQKFLHTQLTYCLYWATKALTSIINFKLAEKPFEQVFVIINLLISLLVFAALIGDVTSIISNMDAQKSLFQQKVDSIKSYMKMRKVSKDLQKKVLQWFEYSWLNSQGLDEDKVKRVLPENLQTEVSMFIHYNTLKQVHIFQDCEPGLLQELVNKLVLQVFSPGDYICRKGDIGREMYFVKRGVLHVVSDDGKTVFAKLREGSYFGEISILDIKGSRTGNRRTANVVSVGYSDLFCLTKDELWKALVEYPLAKKTLIDKGKSLLKKDNLLDEDNDTNNNDAEIEIKRQNEIRLIRLKDDLENLSLRVARFIGSYKANLIKVKKRM
jgi:cyclic nucleotide gated channel alpha 3